jgi:hypothetical protein
MNVTEKDVARVEGLIRLAQQGVDAGELVDSTFTEISEGHGGGPYPIGSMVKLNKPWSGASIDEKQVSLQKGDVVSIIQPVMGATGHDKMVLFPDGMTKAVLPLDVLGESIQEQDGVISGRFVGDAEKPKSNDELKGSKDPTSIQSTMVGTGSWKTASQPQGSQTPTLISGKKVEAIQQELHSQISQAISEAGSLKAKQDLTALLQAIPELNDAEKLSKIYSMVCGNESHSIDAINKVLAESITEAERYYWRLTVKGAKEKAVASAEKHGCKNVKVFDESKDKKNTFLDAEVSPEVLSKWFAKAPNQPPFPDGTLLYFSELK